MIRHALSAALVAALLVAAPAGAATSTSRVTGLVGTELSLAVTTPPAPMTFSPSTDGAATSLLAITSTTAWTLTIHDAGSTTPGRMDKVDCATRAAGAGSLTDALSWANAAATTSGSLSGTPATVAQGTGISTQTVALTQTVPATESLTAADCYELTATYTLS
jgi:hypothetical protein